MSGTWKPAALAVLTLALVHGWLAAAPGSAIGAPMSLALFATNVYVLYCARAVAVARSGRSLALFAAGYAVLLVLVALVLGQRPLFILLIIVYASVFRSPLLLGLFAIFVLSFVLLQPYAIETFVPLALTYAVTLRAQGLSFFVRACLAGGLLAFGFVLLPLVHLVVQDSAQTLVHTAQRPDVQAALALSVVSASLATAVITLFGVPLAYALARGGFAGRRLVESLVDLPILVPQSVAGIALMLLFGPGSPLGQGLHDALGLEISGSLVGLVLAQVFVASPFLVKTALAAFAGVPERLELASRSLGVPPGATFRRVSLPLAARGIALGMALAWARAVSELGAVILFASSPLTAPVLVHTEFLRAGVSESRPIATLLLLTCIWVFVLWRLGPSLLPSAAPRSPGAPRS